MLLSGTGRNTLLIKVPMSTIQRVKGMQDVLPEEQAYRDYVLREAVALAQRAGFDRFDVPVIEKHELFERGIGTSADFFVQKEMYTIEEPDGSLVSLRPEFTAGVIRAWLQNGLASWTQPVKLYTIGPIFRRERPQAGRLRQHTQFNCEILGESDPAADVEVMLLAMDLYRRLGYRGLIFQLNSTGCRECRPIYVEKLRAYLEPLADRLAPVDRDRLQKNPLRVLDSKEPGMADLLAQAPHLAEHLCDDCADHFSRVRALLETLEQPYAINFRLVRGMDYYEKTVFEVWAEGIGAQSAVCGGGRYDLAPEIGGPSVPSVGFGSGVERIIMGLREAGITPPAPPRPRIMVAHFGGETGLAAMRIAQGLRSADIGAWLAFSRHGRSLKSQLREANKRQAAWLILVGEAELAQGSVMVRSLEAGTQETVPLDQIVPHMQQVTA
jgi:histidyl-tRNA synthetase